MVRHHVTFSQEIIYHAHEPKLRKNVQHPLSPRFTLDRPVLIFIYSSSFSLSLFSVNNELSYNFPSPSFIYHYPPLIIIITFYHHLVIYLQFSTSFFPLFSSLYRPHKHVQSMNQYGGGFLFVSQFQERIFGVDFYNTCNCPLYVTELLT